MPPGTVSVCFTLKRQILVLSFVSENSFIKCLVGDIFRPSQSYQKSFRVCVCVYEAHEQNRATHSCYLFHRTVVPLAPYCRIVDSLGIRKEKRKQFTYSYTVLHCIL